MSGIYMILKKNTINGYKKSLKNKNKERHTKRKKEKKNRMFYLLSIYLYIQMRNGYETR